MSVPMEHINVLVIISVSTVVHTTDAVSQIHHLITIASAQEELTCKLQNGLTHQEKDIRTVHTMLIIQIAYLLFAKKAFNYTRPRTTVLI